MALPELLEQCEQITHDERMKLMVKVGQEASTSAERKSQVEELCKGSFYEQFLGLQTCHGTRDLTPILQGLSSRSAILRTRAVNYITVLGNDDEFLKQLHSLPAAQRTKLLKGLRRRKRLTAIDAYLTELEAAADTETQELFEKYLPLASTDLFCKHLPGLVETLDDEILAQLPIYHPEETFKIVGDTIARLGTVEPVFLHTVNVLLDHIKPAYVNGCSFWSLVLNVVTRLPKSISLCDVHLSQLIQNRPREVAQLVIERGDKKFPSLSSVLPRLLTAQLLALQQLNSDTISWTQFSSLNREQRLAVYEVMRLKWRQTDGTLYLNVVSDLPEKERIAEARRIIQLPVFETNPSGRIPFIALLPWDEAMPLQQPFLRSSEADIRSETISAQVTAAGVQPARLSDALALLVQRGREQDPVRNIFLYSLSELPAWKWKTVHLDSLSRIVRDALDAVDLSWSSVDRLLQLAAQLLHFHTQWASKHLALVMGERHQVPYYLKLKNSPKGVEVMKVLDQDLLPVFQAFQRKEEESQLITLARALEKNVKHFPAFVSLLEEVLSQTKHSSHATSLLDVLKEYLPDRLPEVIPKLLDSDPGWIALGFVQDYVRENDLTAYKGLETHIGRFGCIQSSWNRKIEPRWVPWRLTKSEQEAKKAELVESIGDKDQSVDVQQGYITKLASLCFVEADKLIEFASEDRIVIRDSAIRELGSLDAGQGIPILIEALTDDERAKVAIYALRRALTSMPKAEALTILRGTPLRKITVAKEVIRIAGDLESDDAYAFLVGLSKADPPLHRDALIALLGALAPLASRPDVTAIFQNAAAHPEPSVATEVLSQVPHGPRFEKERLIWNDLILRLLRHPSAEVRNAALRRCMRDLNDREKLLHPALFELLGSKDEAEVDAAASAVMRVYGWMDSGLVLETFKLFVHDIVATGRLVQSFTTISSAARDDYLSSTMDILTLLASVRLTLSQRVDLIFQSLPGNVLQSHIVNLGAELHADALVKAEALAWGLWYRSDVVLAPLEAELGASGDEGLRRLGLNVLKGMGSSPERWTGELREKLEGYRRDESVLVAEAAAFLIPPKIEVD